MATHIKSRRSTRCGTAGLFWIEVLTLRNQWLRIKTPIPFKEIPELIIKFSKLGINRKEFKLM